MFPNDCEGQTNVLFIGVNEKLVPLNSVIEPAEFYEEYHEGISPCWTETGELSFTLNGKPAKRLFKMIRTEMNHRRRTIRRIRRLKEKVRRNRLKEVV